MLKSKFPNLNDYTKTSPATQAYNCIAWACGDNTRWWWPDPDPLSISYWPPNVICEESISSFDQLFYSAGASIVSSADYVDGVLKIALFAKANSPTHAARQLKNGYWTSKLGEFIDIAHKLDELEGGEYGEVVRIYAIHIPND